VIRPVFPDPVAVIITYLRDELGGVPVYPNKLPDSLPSEFVQVSRVGGLRSSLVTDRPRIDFGCWSVSEVQAQDLVTRVRALVLGMAGRHGGTTVYDVRDVSAPMWLPDSATGKARFSFAVECSMRATSTLD